MTDDAAVTFTSSSGYLYAIEATSTPDDPGSWAAIGPFAPGLDGSTTLIVHDPGISANGHRFYRAVVRPL